MNVLRTALLLFLVGCGSSGRIDTCPGEFPENYAGSVRLRAWLTLRVVVWFNEGAPLYSQTRRETTITAFRVWEEASKQAIRVDTTDDRSEATVVVEFTDAVSSSCSESRSACTNLRFNGGRLKQATIYLNPTEGNPPLLASHEMGHALGIDGHSPERSDLMYAYANASGIPTARDLNTVRAAYCTDFPGLH